MRDPILDVSNQGLHSVGMFAKTCMLPVIVTVDKLKNLMPLSTYVERLQELAAGFVLEACSLDSCAGLLFPSFSVHSHHDKPQLQRDLPES